MLTFELVRVEWSLDPSTSRVYPLFSSNQMYNMGEMSINKFPLRSVTYSQLKKLSKGQRIRVDGHHFISVGDIKVADKCPCCKRKLDTEQGMLICPAEDCTGKPFIALNNLFSTSRIFEDMTWQQLKAYCRLFPVGKENFTNVLNVSDKRDGLIIYLTLFKQAPKKDTAARADLLIQTFGQEIGENCWKLEVELEKLFAQGLPPDLFWWVLSLDKINDIVAAQKLGKLDPSILLNVYEDHYLAKDMLDKCNLTTEEKMSIIIEKDYWSKVHSILRSIWKARNVT